MKKIILIFFIATSLFAQVSKTGANLNHIPRWELKDSVANVKTWVKSRSAVNVKDYGAVGDGVTDDTEAIQRAVDSALANGGEILFTGTDYKVTSTISLLNENWTGKAISFRGQNGRQTTITFYNEVEGTPLFYFDTKIDYLVFERLNFQDHTPRTSICFSFNGDISSGFPTWKHYFEHIRVYAFKIGAKFDGQTLTSNDAYLDGVTFLQCKFKNNETSLEYDNIQAVNHMYINTDFENDDVLDATEKWTHIRMKRGSTISHVGGSVIGYGRYLEFTYPYDGTAFQSTSRFSSYFVRLETRGDGPFIEQMTTSNITLSHFLRLDFTDMSISMTGYSDPKLANFGGSCTAQFANCIAASPMDIRGYMTSNLSANGQYGNIIIKDSKNLLFERIADSAAYGSDAVWSGNYRNIPVEISSKVESAIGTNDGSGYFVLNNYASKVYAGGWETSQPKILVYAPKDASGFGSGHDPDSLLVTLPKYARPYKFRVVKDYINVSSDITLTLTFVIGGVDYDVATITGMADSTGTFESNIALPSPLTRNYVDGTVWDGRVKIKKSGSTNAFLGLIIVEYL